MRRGVLAAALLAGGACSGPSPSPAVPTHAANPTPSTFRVVNTDGYPSDSLAVFDRLGRSAKDVGPAHSTAVVRVTATGSRAVVLRSLAVPAGWRVDAVLPMTIAGGSAVDLPVRFVAPGDRKIHRGALVLDSDDPTAPHYTVTLQGFALPAAGGSNEPSLAEIAELFGLRTVVLSAGQSITGSGSAAKLVGSEVRARGFTPADPRAPVEVRELAAFHAVNTVGHLGWRGLGDPEDQVRPLLAQDALDGQAVLPRAVGGGAATSSFRPRGPFALVAEGQDTDDARNDPTHDRTKSGCLGPCGHHVRSFPVVDGEGRTVPGSYLVAMTNNLPAPGSGGASPEAIDYDYNDAVYLLANVTPVA